MQGFAFVVRADFATGPLPHGRVQPKGRSGLLEGLTFAFGMGTGVAPPALRLEARSRKSIQEEICWDEAALDRIHG